MLLIMCCVCISWVDCLLLYFRREYSISLMVSLLYYTGIEWRTLLKWMIEYCRQILISNAGFILLCQIFDLEALIELFFVLILFWAAILYTWHYGKLFSFAKYSLNNRTKQNLGTTKYTHFTVVSTIEYGQSRPSSTRGVFHCYHKQRTFFT